jgi:hypothetical protein
VASLAWPSGYQVFDIQTLPDTPQGRLPFAPDRPGEINNLLRYLG